jgi:hypothetical protein
LGMNYMFGLWEWIKIVVDECKSGKSNRQKWECQTAISQRVLLCPTIIIIYDLEILIQIFISSLFGRIYCNETNLFDGIIQSVFYVCSIPFVNMYLLFLVINFLRILLLKKIIVSFRGIYSIILLPLCWTQIVCYCYPLSFKDGQFNFFKLKT